MTSASIHGAIFLDMIAHASRLLRRAVVRAAALDVAVADGGAPSPTDLRRLRLDLSTALTDFASLLSELRTARSPSRPQMNGVSAQSGLVIGRDGAARLRDIERELRRVRNGCVQKELNERTCAPEPLGVITAWARLGRRQEAGAVGRLQERRARVAVQRRAGDDLLACERPAHAVRGPDVLAGLDAHALGCRDRRGAHAPHFRAGSDDELVRVDFPSRRTPRVPT